MNLTESMQNSNRALEKLINKCWEDETFKKQLVANPVETMESFYGGPLKKKNNIVVEDQTDSNTIYLNLYSKPNYDDFELGDNELDEVAGGWFVTLLWSGICFGDGEPASTSLSVGK
jgi:hypothetical protein